jgi:hypothetical protein
MSSSDELVLNQNNNLQSIENIINSDEDDDDQNTISMFEPNMNPASEESVDEEISTDYNNEISNISDNFITTVNPEMFNNEMSPIDDNIFNNFILPALTNLPNITIPSTPPPHSGAITPPGTPPGPPPGPQHAPSHGGHNMSWTTPDSPDDSPYGSPQYETNILSQSGYPPPGLPTPGLPTPVENPQYNMLNNDDDDNPFAKCNISKLEYDTDEEETNDIRIIITWNYEFNYDYFSLTCINIYGSKTDIFHSQLNELKNIRNTNISNLTGKIYKLKNNDALLTSSVLDLYLIVYYDNVKSDIEFYGIFNQEIEEVKLIENIKREGIYGTKGIVDNNNITNLGDNDFIVIHRKVSII